jgi:hypothetical protein
MPMPQHPNVCAALRAETVDLTIPDETVDLTFPDDMAIPVAL